MFKVDMQDLIEVERAMADKDYEAVLAKIEDIETRAGKLGAHLHWVKGVCQDVLGEPVEALKTFKLGLNIDSLYHNLLASWRVTLSNMCDQLARMENEDVELNFFKELNCFLVEVGSMTSDIQYRLLRNYLVRHAYDDFDPLLRNALERNPLSLELLELQKLREVTIPLSLVN